MTIINPESWTPTEPQHGPGWYLARWEIGEYHARYWGEAGSPTPGPPGLHVLHWGPKIDSLIETVEYADQVTRKNARNTKALRLRCVWLQMGEPGAWDHQSPEEPDPNACGCEPCQPAAKEPRCTICHDRPQRCGKCTDEYVERIRQAIAATAPPIGPSCQIGPGPIPVDLAAMADAMRVFGATIRACAGAWEAVIRDLERTGVVDK